jgi:hypothetical protein
VRAAFKGGSECLPKEPANEGHSRHRARKRSHNYSDNRTSEAMEAEIGNSFTRTWTHMRPVLQSPSAVLNNHASPIAITVCHRLPPASASLRHRRREATLPRTAPGLTASGTKP